MRKVFISIALVFAISNLTMASAGVRFQHVTESQINIPKITVQQGAIVIASASDIELTVDVYSITGQLVKRVRFSNGSITLEVKSGCYIIKCDRWSKKVIVN